MEHTTTTQLDQLEQAIIARFQGRIDDPRFNNSPAYTLAMRQAMDVVKLEMQFAREGVQA